VAALTEREQERWLDLAEENEWGVHELRRRVKWGMPTLETPAPQASTYNFIYADPPWQYHTNVNTSSNRAVENHNPTMPTDDICALEVPSADNALLYIWATSPKLEEAFQVIDVWGFTYKTMMVWVKDKIGMGYWAPDLRVCAPSESHVVRSVLDSQPGSEPHAKGRKAGTRHEIDPRLQITFPVVALARAGASPDTTDLRCPPRSMSRRRFFFTEGVDPVLNGIALIMDHQVRRCWYLTLVEEDKLDWSGLEFRGPS